MSEPSKSHELIKNEILNEQSTIIDNYNIQDLKEAIIEIKKNSQTLDKILNGLEHREKKIKQLLVYGFFDKDILKERNALKISIKRVIESIRQDKELDLSLIKRMIENNTLHILDYNNFVFPSIDVYNFYSKDNESLNNINKDLYEIMQLVSRGSDYQEIINKLQQHPYAINIQTALFGMEGNTFLHILEENYNSNKSSHDQLINYLIKNNADIAIKNQEEYTVLDIAINNKKFDFIYLLLKAYKKYGKEKIILDQIFSDKYKSESNKFEEIISNITHHVIKQAHCNDDSIIKKDLENLAIVLIDRAVKNGKYQWMANTQDSEGTPTLLRLAMKNKQENIAVKLIEAGANILKMICILQ